MDKILSTPIKIVMIVAGGASLLLGPLLFLWPTGTEIYFAWTIKQPLTPIFMGAAYFASALGVFLAVRENRWAVARVIMPGITLFSIAMTIATALHVSIFNWHHIIAWGWLITYVGVPPFMGVLYPREERGFQPPSGTLLGSVFSIGMRGLAGISILVGLALFLFPSATAPLWVWSLTPLTARVVGGWFLANGTTQWLLSRQMVFETARAGMIMKMCFSGLCLLGLFWQRAAIDGPVASLGLYGIYHIALLILIVFVWQSATSQTHKGI